MIPLQCTLSAHHFFSYTLKMEAIFLNESINLYTPLDALEFYEDIIAWSYIECG